MGSSEVSLGYAAAATSAIAELAKPIMQRVVDEVLRAWRPRPALSDEPHSLPEQVNLYPANGRRPTGLPRLAARGAHTAQEIVNRT